MKRIALILMLTFGFGQAQALISGVDDGGYYYTDSDEAGFSYDFDDITADINKVSVSLGDDSTSSINIGFNFIFYDVSYSSLRVSSNGFISFTNSGSGCCSGEIIPSATAFSDMGAGVAAWWEDLYPRSGSTVHYLKKGTTPNRELIIQFTDVPAYSNSGRNTFQYKLKEADQSIEVHYKELYGDNGNYTIGLQKSATVGLQYYRGVGGNSQNNVPAFTLPHAIKYAQTGVGYSDATGGAKGISKPGESQTVNMDIINREATAVDIQISYISSSPYLTLTGPATYTVNANSTAIIPYSILVSPLSTGQLNGRIRVSSLTNAFDSFEIPLIVFISDVDQLSFGSTNNTEKAKLSDDGKYLVVLSRDDLAGNGKLNSSTDLFLYDVENSNFQQLTQNAAGRHCYNSAISGNGLFAASVCNGNLDPSQPNFDSSNEVYIFDLTANTLKQIGSNIHAGTNVDDISMDHEGSILLFISTDNLESENTDGSEEVFSYRLSNQKIRQLSWFNYVSNVAQLDIDYNGERFVVASRGRPLSGQNNNRRWQIFTGNINSGVDRQITNDSSRDSWQPKISANGKYITFSSQANILSNSSSRYQIYLAEFDGEILKKITNSTSQNSYEPDISADGSKVVFRSQGSFDGANSSSNDEIFVFDVQQDSTTQLTEINENHNALYPSLSANGTHIAFSGTGDWYLGQNPSRSTQLFLISGLEENTVKGYDEPQAPALPIIVFDDSEEVVKKRSTESGGYFSWFLLLLFTGLAFNRKQH